MENPAKRSLKKSLTGFEVEMFTINREGYIVGEADKLLKKSKSDRNFTIKKECAANMIEIASYPGENVRNTMDYLLRELEYLVSISEKEKIFLCPLGSYPGKFILASPSKFSGCLRNYQAQPVLLRKWAVILLFNNILKPQNIFIHICRC